MPREKKKKKLDEKLIPKPGENLEIKMTLSGENELDVEVAKMLSKAEDPDEFVLFAVRRATEIVKAGVKEEDFNALINTALVRKAKERLKRKNYLDKAHTA